MTKLSFLTFGLLLGACSSDMSGPDPTNGPSAIEMRQATGDVVNGSSFTCTGTWPSAWTPCSYDWTSTPATDAYDVSAQLVRLNLGRHPIPVDGGASTVYIELSFAAEGHVLASAAEFTTRAGNLQTLESSAPVSGWIAPTIVGQGAAMRNAGDFSLTFAWGSISGTYDSHPQ
jgi:hypothetical protein